MRKKSSRKNNKDLSRRQVPEQCVRCGRKPPTHFMSALQRMKSVTIVRNKDTTPECANIKEKPDQMRGKPIKNQLHLCTCEGQEFEETMYYAEQLQSSQPVRQVLYSLDCRLDSLVCCSLDPVRPALCLEPGAQTRINFKVSMPKITAACSLDN